MSVKREIVWGGDSISIKSAYDFDQPSACTSQHSAIIEPEFARTVLETGMPASEYAHGLVLNGLVRSLGRTRSKGAAHQVAQRWSSEVVGLNDVADGEIVSGVVSELGRMISYSKTHPVTRIAARRARFELELSQVNTRHQLGLLMARTQHPTLFAEGLPLINDVLDEPGGSSSRYFGVSPKLLRNGVTLINSLDVMKKRVAPLKDSLERITSNRHTRQQRTGIIIRAAALSSASREPTRLRPHCIEDYEPAVEIIMREALMHMPDNCSVDTIEQIGAVARMVLHTAVAPVVVR